MLQIRLSNKAATSESGGGAKLPSGETVTVACPDHLVLAELPVAKSLGSASGVTLVKTVGRRSRRHLGERVHFCVQCDFPIAIYGRLIPCEHAFCLDCARSDSICYLCDERIQKIQTIKMMEGILICAAPHCLKSFLKKTDFEAHVYAIHSDLINSNTQKEVNNESEPLRKPTTSDSTVQAPTPRLVQDGLQPPPMVPVPVRPLMNPKPNPQPPMDTRPHGFDGPPYDYPMNMNMSMGMSMSMPPNFVVPVNVMGGGPASFGQPMYVGPPETGPWNGAPFDPSMMMNQGGGGGGVGFFQGGLLQGGNGVGVGNDLRDGRGILPPPPPPFVGGGYFGGGGGDMGQHGQGQGYGWQQEKRDAFNGGQD
ncbi:unnamed protein product [Lactuca virosa]|uniref:RING-type E3 ubiquitin transferase n=1 Tax=Lactuca virosa TaxID=75947 RepID=A0AAU9LVS9_9ASTR|nr:unnamed protein product [Lactuca virosa]